MWVWKFKKISFEEWMLGGSGRAHLQANCALHQLAEEKAPHPVGWGGLGHPIHSGKLAPETVDTGNGL